MSKILMAVGILVLLTAGMVQAQTREGRWVGLGLGVGSFNDDGGIADLVAHVGIGAFVSERLMITAEASFLRNSRVAYSSLGPVVHFYPSRSGGFFLKINGGLAHVTQESSQGKSSDTSLAVSVGLGIDISIGESMSIRLFANTGIGGNSTIWTLREIGVGVSWP